MNYVISALGPNQAQWLTSYDPNYYHNYRFSNGPVWVDQLYTQLGFGPLESMTANDGVNNMNGTNFSWAGSRSGAGVYGLIFPNLLLQVDTYSTQIANGNPFLPAPETTLFTVWSGANDVFASVEDDEETITPFEVANNVGMAITSLYDEGGRYFLVPNLPPIGLIPSYLNDPVKGPMATAFVNAFNDELAFRLDQLSENLEGITIFEVDVHTLFLDIMDDPAAYGFTNVTDTAYIRYGPPYVVMNPPWGEVVPNPDGYFYWDAAHGTTAANVLIAEAAYQSIVPEPSTLCLIAAGLGVFALRRKYASGDA